MRFFKKKTDANQICDFAEIMRMLYNSGADLEIKCISVVFFGPRLGEKDINLLGHLCLRKKKAEIKRPLKVGELCGLF